MDAFFFSVKQLWLFPKLQLELHQKLQPALVDMENETKPA